MVKKNPDPGKSPIGYIKERERNYSVFLSSLSMVPQLTWYTLSNADILYDKALCSVWRQKEDPVLTSTNSQIPAQF
jgi:hypothetical protein